MGSVDFSESPEGIKHRIFSFLPLKDVVRTCALSKSWEHAWSSNAFLDFDVSVFEESVIYCSGGFHNAYRHPIRRWIFRFIRFVDRCLACREPSAGIERLRLSLRGKHRWYHAVQKWVSLAATVKEFCLTVKEMPCFVLPQAVLRLRSLTVLKLHGVQLAEPLTCPNLPHLRKISLKHVQINDEMLRGLLGICPSIETLCLKSCYRLKNIQISSLSLKSVVLYCREQVEMVEIKAFNLQTFRYGQGPMPNLQVIYKLNLIRMLSIEDPKMTDDEFEELIIRLPLLESLILICSNTLKHARISSETLRSISIGKHNNVLEKVDINAPILLRLSYDGSPDCSFSMTSPHLLEVKIKLPDICIRTVEEWYPKLCRFLVSFNHAKLLTLTCSAKALLFPEELAVDPPLKEIRHLELNLTSSTLSKSKLTSSLLWLCPSLETLLVNLEQIEKCFKFQCGTASEKAQICRTLEPYLQLLAGFPAKQSIKGQKTPGESYI